MFSLHFYDNRVAGKLDECSQYVVERIQIIFLGDIVIQFCNFCLSISLSLSLCVSAVRVSPAAGNPRALSSIPATDQSLPLMSKLTLEQRSIPFPQHRTPPLIIQ